MEVSHNIEECSLSDLEMLNMDFALNYYNLTQGFTLEADNSPDSSNSLDEGVYFEPNFCSDFEFGFDEKQQPSFHVLQHAYNTIQCQPTFQTKDELTDCLYANNLEPNQSWTIPQVPFDTQIAYTCPQEPLPKPEFMDIREMKKELPEQIEINNIPEKPQRRKPGRKKGQLSNVYHLWEFIRDLLKDPHNKNLITWEDRDKGIFRMIKSGEVAKLWGLKKKNKRQMNYEKMSRSLRYSRKEGYFMAIPRDGSYPKKLCFRFGPKSHGWK